MVRAGWVHQTGLALAKDLRDIPSSRQAPRLKASALFLVPCRYRRCVSKEQWGRPRPSEKGNRKLWCSGDGLERGTPRTTPICTPTHTNSCERARISVEAKVYFCRYF